MDELSLKKSAQKVQQALATHGLGLSVVEFPAATRTAQQAADAIKCDVAQIAKSLIFKTKLTQQPILVIASGKNRVNETKISQIIGQEIQRADADFVLLTTGFAIGGIPPVGHINQLKTLIDEDLLQYTEIWAAAGTPHAVFKLTPQDLIKITNGQVVLVF